MKFDGLILESHIDPDHAWSDAKQQITPEKAGELFESIVWPQQGDVKNDHELEKYRQQINHLDDELFQVLSQRMKIADKIGQYKKDHDMSALQTSRWSEIIEKYESKAEKLGLSKEFIASYLEAVHIESINHQNAVMSEGK
ncbi:chorismate mutase [Polluticoccus soli]